jgi:uncharacterized protein YndB with AHSA1/START domain
MTAPADNLGEVTYTRVYKAPRELVFDCMTMPAHLAKFWGPIGVTTPVENITVDLRPGGLFETVMINDADGAEYPMRAVYVDVERPSRLSWTEEDVEGGMMTSITFNDLGDGTTEVVSHQTNVPEVFRSAQAQAGMQTSFDKFDAYLASLSHRFGSPQAGG